MNKCHVYMCGFEWYRTSLELDFPAVINTVKYNIFFYFFKKGVIHGFGKMVSTLQRVRVPCIAKGKRKSYFSHKNINLV